MLRRPRRNRKSGGIRRMIRENLVRTENLIYPLFVTDGVHKALEIKSLPGNYIWSCDRVLSEIEECLTFGLDKFILFPKVDAGLKDREGSYGLKPDNFYLEACRKIKKRFPDTVLISDVALDPYNSDGHDGLVRNGRIANDETLVSLGKMAVLQAEAGFDVLGPSDMMDGRIGHVRMILDDSGYQETSIMSYTAKYASAYYGPFRDALDSAPVAGHDIPKDKKSYQVDPANGREALIEAELDVQEGADFLMVKPALHYLDVIHSLRQEFDLPITAYHVSGECAMLLAACRNGWLDYETAMPEVLLSIRRAGADGIITYFAKDFAQMQ